MRYIVVCDVRMLFFPNRSDVHYPDTVAVTYDPVHRWLSCVYKDHSLYVWDVQDLRRVGMVHSALYHAASVWDLQVIILGLTQYSGLFYVVR